MKTTVASAALAIALVTGCGSVTNQTINPSIAPSASPPSSTRTASPSLAPTTAPSATAPATTAPATTAPSATATAASFPVPEQIEPAAIIDVPGSGFISVASDGTSVWAGATGVVLRIDATTNAVERLDAPVARDDTTLTIADDGLWVTQWAGGRLYRLDPATAQVLLEVEMPKAVRVAFVGEEMWVGREDLGSMARVDRVTGEVSSNVVLQGAYGTAGMGDLWFTDDSLKVVRVDPATGDDKATIDFPGETNCTMYASFPDNVWTACFGREVMSRSASRIDPITNTVATVATLPPSHGGSVIVIAGRPWFLGSFEDSDGEPFAGLLRIDAATGAIDRFLALAGADPDPSVVAGNALWIPDEAGDRILKVDFAQLTD
jgi:streptogramin lyase